MFEVIPFGNGFRWQLISAEGRVLVYSQETVGCSLEAKRQADGFRQQLWGIAQFIDHRQARCI